MHDPNSVDITIIGAGLAGLTAAVLAARRGARVTVLAGRVPGGRALTDRVDGFHLNQGAHALYLGGDAARTWAKLEVDVPSSAPRFPLFAESRGTLHRLPTDPVTLLATTLLSVPSKIRLAAILARLGGLAGAAGPGPFGPWLDAHTRDPEVRRALVAVARLATFTADPTRLDAAAVLRQLQLAAGGVCYVHHGWQSAVDALARAATRAGASLLPARADSVDHTPGGYVVTTRDGEFASDAIIVATGPVAFTRLTGISVPDLVPVRAAALDLGLRALPKPAVPFVLDLDHPRYGSVQSLAADVAPDGAAVLHVLAYLEPDETAQRASLETWVDSWQPGWRDQVHAARWRPGLVVQHRAALPEAPVLTAEVAPGLLRAGDWVGHGFLSDAAVSSAVEAVDRALLHGALRRAG